ncbi:hypothetical protein DFA_08340 [Cavenderia fasciculata]|uniref:Uncharacterized protein n=1 Tax=Cavenderia fasciculata TaxID=261658 RepID=F4Q5T6_CACFS|nr:uncharacterized protein DFA_08340 [Cavenderia fasciculata]EGG17345.1 hypothetical protein DFA_08340 [Cavenderia fasciculata]|eukprot:XP_004355829.1 hypothetical protein DFA_08340 [Cavenderia fasciculata]
MPPKDTFTLLTSLVTLKIKIKRPRTDDIVESCIDLQSLQNLETFKLGGCCWHLKSEIRVLSSSPLLKKLVIKGQYGPTIKYLWIPLNPIQLGHDGYLIYSIKSRIPKTITDQLQQPQPQKWLPANTTHLTCYLTISSQVSLKFRLNEVINHTNVRYLTLVIGDGDETDAT